MIKITSYGMSEEELIDLSKDYPFRSIGCMELEFYGLGREIRRYGYYPKSLPIFLSSEHGICLWDHPQNYNLNAKFPYMLVHSKRMQKAWRVYSKIPCFVMQSPFVTYRRRKNINLLPTASGTLVFFGHSTKEIDITIDINNYINSLKNLPKIFQPVSICMHFVDIQKGYHKPFLENSFKVYTAGNWLDPDFMPRFYEILRQFKFAISNCIGSYMFYAVEMGIPFSIYGEEPKFYNKSDSSFPLGSWDFKVHKQFAKASSIFKGLYAEVTFEQISFVESELGLHDGISRTKMTFVLYNSLFKWFFSKMAIKYFLKMAYNLLPAVLNRKIYLFRHNLTKETKTFTHLTDAEKISLHSIANQLPSNAVAVEIGSYLGASSCFIANGIKRNNGILYCIDTWENQTMPDGERDTYAEFQKNTEKYRDIIVPIREWSSKAIIQLKERETKIDLLFIDGDHSYEICKADWDNYSSLLSKNSIVIFHDTGWADGVKRVVAELVINVAGKILELQNMQAFKMRQ